MGKYALLIGVDTYGEGLQPLPAASKDVAALREVLLNPQMGGFDQAKPLINPTQPEMAREIELWFQDRQPEDLVLLFFSGHGVKDDRRELFFAARNTEKQHDYLIRSTATSAQFIHDCISRCKAKYQVLILDSCFSGAFGELVGKDDGEIPLQEQLGAEGRVVLTSTSAVDYSFEEKGADLSIYTRYLVEGIATGAADEDSDGVITVEELHRYAGRKVQEASPAMSPKIFIPLGEGYRIKLARSPQDDPKLKYRKEAERRATGAEFTIPAKRILILLRAELGLSESEAEAIEAEVLRPHREYQKKLEEYHAILQECLEKEKILSPKVIEDLIALREHLKLREEDVAPVERRSLNGSSLKEYETYNSQKIEQDKSDLDLSKPLPLTSKEMSEGLTKDILLDDGQRITINIPAGVKEGQKLRIQGKGQVNPDTHDRGDLYLVIQPQEVSANSQEKINILQQNQEDDLSSERFGANYYAKLRDLLAAQDWKAADKETADRMCEVMDRQKEGWLGAEDIKKFPCQDLRNIDRLWVRYSQGKFSFSVQKKIWEICGSPTSYGTGWEKFGVIVGWRTEGKWGEWLPYSRLTYSLDAPKGHLPSGRTGIDGGLGRGMGLLHGRRGVGWGFRSFFQVGLLFARSD
ncbi:MAG: GUN4 domain-containing protein [Synechococcales cyanobacterium C42_A2020_086]|jgi:uncharacterized caspase-like protein|nr:GUN4 domain-containing protein [Synechococcales cyanobacterium C42_A2020_086]